MGLALRYLAAIELMSKGQDTKKPATNLCELWIDV
jgi:hypothetical protein